MAHSFPYLNSAIAFGVRYKSISHRQKANFGFSLMAVLHFRNKFKLLLIEDVKFKTSAIVALNGCCYLAEVMGKSDLNNVMITSVI